METKRKYNEPITISSGRKIIPTDEILFNEIQSAIDFKEVCQGQKDADVSENSLNKKYLNFAEYFEGILEDDDFLLKLYHFAHLKSQMELIRRFKEDKISISIFSDKYGNKYLKAKAAFPEYSFIDGKKKTTYKSVSIHLGKLDDFKGGVNDEKAKSKARELLLGKAKLMMELQYIDNDNMKQAIKKKLKNT